MIIAANYSYLEVIKYFKPTLIFVRICLWSQFGHLLCYLSSPFIDLTPSRPYMIKTGYQKSYAFLS